MSIKAKFIIIGIISVITVLLLVAHSRIVSKQKLETIYVVANITEITRRHMECDMMHDAIRGDVFAALSAINLNNEDGRKKVLLDLADHYNTFKDNLSKNQAGNIPQNIRDSLIIVDGLLKDYNASAEAVVKSSKDNVQNLMPLFENKFDQLEDKMAEISESLDDWLKKEKDGAQQISDKSEIVGLFLSMITVLLSLFVPVYATISIFKPQEKLIDEMGQLADGNLSVEINGLERKDEIGKIAKALEVFKKAANDKDKMEKEHKFAEVRAKEEKRQAMNDLANKFQDRVQTMINSVAAAATELNQISESMKNSIDDVGSKATQASSYSSKTAQNVNTVASASEEMAASVKEISNQVSKSTQAVNEAVVKAENASGSARSLEEATIKIGDIIGLIRDIAEQINLLALNATIESARAGEAGKGFAVVASEVKNLASQTTKATDDIANQIESVQGVSSQVVESLNAIKASVDRVNEFSGGIASAVEQQSATTNEIARSMQVAAQGTQEISESVGNITESTSQARESSSHMLDASKMLSVQAEQLSLAVETFLNEIRNG